MAQGGEDGEGGGEVVDADGADGCVEGREGGEGWGGVEVLKDGGGEDGVA